MSTNADPQPGQIEPIIKWLFVLVLILVFTVIGISKWSPNDGQTFQVISGVLTTFAGVLAGRINPVAAKKPDPPPGSITHTEQVTQTPPDPPDAK